MPAPDKTVSLLRPHRRGTGPWSVLCLAAACALLTCGCWGSLDIEERAIVTMVGIDRGEKGVKVSLEVAINEKMAKEGGDGGGGGGEEAFVVVHEDEASTAEAIHRLQDKVSMPMYLGHLKVVVFGEEFARESGIMEPLAALTRHPEIRGQVWIAVARGTAEDLMHHRIKAERLPAAYLERLLNTGKRFGHTADSRLSAVSSKLDLPGYHPLLPILKADEGSVEIENAAVFFNDRLVGELEHDEMHDFALVEGVHTAGTYSIPSPRGRGKLYVLLRGARKKVSVTQDGDRVTISLKIRADGNVVEDSGDAPRATAGTETAGKVVKALERQLNDEISHHVEDLIKKVQTQYGADIFGFSRHAGRLKFEEKKWDAVFPTADVHVEVNVMLRKFGLGEV